MQPKGRVSLKPLSRDAARMAARRAAETPEQRYERLEKCRIQAAARRAAETPEQKLHRLEVARALVAAKRAAETPEQRVRRLEVLRVQAAAKRAAETPEQRFERLRKCRIQAAARRAGETPQQRLRRLEIMRNIAAMKRASETEEERLFRLDIERQRAAARRAGGRFQYRPFQLNIFNNVELFNESHSSFMDSFQNQSMDGVPAVEEPTGEAPAQSEEPSQPEEVPKRVRDPRKRINYIASKLLSVAQNRSPEDCAKSEELTEDDDSQHPPNSRSFETLQQTQARLSSRKKSAAPSPKR